MHTLNSLPKKQVFDLTKEKPEPRDANRVIDDLIKIMEIAAKTGEIL